VEIPLATEMPAPTETQIPSATVDTRLSPEDWAELANHSIGKSGNENPFSAWVGVWQQSSDISKIGDGEISTVWFLTQYDMDPSNYHLGAHTELQPLSNTSPVSFAGLALQPGAVITQRSF